MLDAYYAFNGDAENYPVEVFQVFEFVYVLIRTLSFNKSRIVLLKNYFF